MREIKFRAWNATMGMMIDLQRLTPLATDIDGLFLPHADDIILLQYTGLKDKNGVEIYEGDVVYLPHVGARCQVFWQQIGIGAVGYSRDLAKGEVIGNIYENPELAK